MKAEQYVAATCQTKPPYVGCESLRLLSASFTITVLFLLSPNADTLFIIRVCYMFMSVCVASLS